MDRSKAMERIRKCLAMTGSPNANEAAIAMRQAQKLMAEYDISALDAAAPKISGVPVAADSKTGAGWEGAVAVTVADALGIEVYRSRGYPRANWVFYGNADRVALAEFAHVSLRRAVIKARTAYLKGLRAKGYTTSGLRSEGRAFAYGFAAEVKKAVSSLFMSPEEEAAIERWKGERGLVLRSRRSRASLSAGGYSAGQEAGRGYGMNRPVGGVGGPAALIGA